MQRGFEVVSKEMRKQDEEVFINLPLRATKTSAGYDFYTPIDLVIPPQTKLFFWTDVKAKMLDGEVLLLDIRSSMGVNNDLMMANTIPVIDSDYHNNAKNEGNIGICLRNLKTEFSIKGYNIIEAKMFDIERDMETGEQTISDTFSIEKVSIPVIDDLREENTVFIKAGERIAQGIFVEYKQAENCNSEEDRQGGFGSTTK